MYIDEAVKEAIAFDKCIARQIAFSRNSSNVMKVSANGFLYETGGDDRKLFSPTLDDLIANDWIIVKKGCSV